MNPAKAERDRDVVDLCRHEHTALRRIRSLVLDPARRRRLRTPQDDDTPRALELAGDDLVERLAWEDLPLDARLTDLSRRGAFVDSIVTFDLGAVVNLKFTVPSLQVSVVAEVVNVRPNEGMGLQFRNLTPAQKVAIGEVVRSSILFGAEPFRLTTSNHVSVLES